MARQAQCHRVSSTFTQKVNVIKRSTAVSRFKNASKPVSKTSALTTAAPLVDAKAASPDGGW